MAPLGTTRLESFALQSVKRQVPSAADVAVVGLAAALLFQGLTGGPVDSLGMTAANAAALSV